MESNISGQNNWLLAHYLPVSLFSLRMSCSTNKGGKTLFVPTPYSFKLAMVDAAFRMGDEGLAGKVFDLIKAKDIRFKPPKHLTVQNTFIKIKQEDREDASGVYNPTIAYREFCFFKGQLTIAIDASGLETEAKELLWRVLAHINYLGKRGSFWQFMKWEEAATLPDGFTVPDTVKEFRIDGYGVIQQLDDIGETDSKDIFDRINTYSDKPIVLGKHRVITYTFLPYKVKQSSKEYTYYEGKG
ncbi:MAG: type I-A CRISPR-associated protein Cas5 [Candidatus Schekmanbacteria bacterium]|nr:type I-A CRISPR-associated protein Cas5 [Candidatus Schekmanbacteria bacterium]